MSEPKFPIHDDETPLDDRSSSYIPRDQQRKMALLANHLAQIETEMPLLRRIEQWRAVDRAFGTY